MPGKELIPRYQKGDKVRIIVELKTLPPLPGRVGNVKEVIPCYADDTFGYNLVLDADPRQDRIWFFYQDQLAAV